jgi:hypothetical protein
VPGQKYFADYLTTASEPVGLYKHSRPTNTCAEKIELLNQESGKTGWQLWQAVKALFFTDQQKVLYCFVTPEFEKHIDTKHHIGKKTQLALPQLLPSSMELGTCTPMLPEEDCSDSGGRVRRIYIQEDCDIVDMLADISIGGKGAEAHKRSAWIPYGVMTSLLLKQFGDFVEPCRLKYLERSKSFKSTIGEGGLYA